MHTWRPLGKVPPPIAAMNEADPQVLEGYLTMREAIMASREDGLPFKYKELVFVILDLLAGNLDGAKLHLAAGLDAGLTQTRGHRGVVADDDAARREDVGARRASARRLRRLVPGRVGARREAATQ